MRIKRTRQLQNRRNCGRFIPALTLRIAPASLLASPLSGNAGGDPLLRVALLGEPVFALIHLALKRLRSIYSAKS